MNRRRLIYIPIVLLSVSIYKLCPCTRRYCATYKYYNKIFYKDYNIPLPGYKLIKVRGERKFIFGRTNSMKKIDYKRIYLI